MARQLPPLNAVRAFEVASRHLNLTRSAEELGVTQGAVSKQIIALEDHIGVQLFIRGPGGLTLTGEGHNLKEALLPAFTTLGEAFSRYSRRPPRSNVCRITTIASFASQFLVPRLATFRERHPSLELEFTTSDRLVDFGREEYDIGVRYGPGDWDGVVATRLVEGRLAPVCSPTVFKEAGCDTERLFATNRRIQSSAFNEWRRWVEQTGQTLPDRPAILQIDDFLVALRAAVTGAGVALLPDILVKDPIRRGELVAISPERFENEYTFYVSCAPNAVRRPMVQDVIDWLIAEAAEV